MKKLFSILALLPILISCSHMKAPVDLIVFNSKIYTVNSEFRTVESFAIKDGRFIAIGSTDEIMTQYVSDNIIDGSYQFILSETY